MEIDYIKMLNRIDDIVTENDGEYSNESDIANELINAICYQTIMDFGVVYDFCEYYGCSLDYLVGRSDVYGVF